MHRSVLTQNRDPNHIRYDRDVFVVKYSLPATYIYRIYSPFKTSLSSCICLDIYVSTLQKKNITKRLAHGRSLEPYRFGGRS